MSDDDQRDNFKLKINSFPHLKVLLLSVDKRCGTIKILTYSILFEQIMCKTGWASSYPPLHLRASEILTAVKIRFNTDTIRVKESSLGA